MSNLFNDNVIVCNCGGTMDIDGKKLAKACGMTTPCDVSTSLCRDETDRLAKAMTEARSNGTELIVACTQEKAIFDNIAEENECPAPTTVNIREMAGWTDQSANSLPKMAALMRQAGDSKRPGRSLSLISHGRCLIYADAGKPNGGANAALELASHLNGTLGVTVMIANANEDLDATTNVGLVTTGKIRSVSGHFTNFDLIIDKFAQAAPQSRNSFLFGKLQDGVETSCDIIIDLTGDTPLFTGWEKRDGYLRAQADDSHAIAKLEREAMQLIGEFEKPIYVNFDETICAHSRNKINGCSRCLDVCPAGAIKSMGDHVDVDPGICGGCGLCGAVCPSGAIQTAYPPSHVTASSHAPPPLPPCTSSATPLFNKVLLYRFLAQLLRVPVLVFHMVPPTHSTTSIAHTQTHASRSTTRLTTLNQTQSHIATHTHSSRTHPQPTSNHLTTPYRRRRSYLSTVP